GELLEQSKFISSFVEYHFKYDANPNFHSIYPGVEMVGPHSRNPDWMNHQKPNEEMRKKLKPIGYDEDALIKRVKKTKETYTRHVGLIAAGKYILHSDVPAINQLLNILNQFIRDTEPYPQLLEFRFFVAISDSIYAINFSTDYQYLDVKIKQEFESCFKTIH